MSQNNNPIKNRPWRLCTLLIILSMITLSACGDDEPQNPNPTTDTLSDTNSTEDTSTNNTLPDGFHPNTPLTAVFSYANTQGNPGNPEHLYRLTNDGTPEQSQSTLPQISNAIDCSLGQCWVTSDGSHLVLLKTSNGSLEIAPADANGIFAANNLQFIDEGVTEIKGAGTRLVYIARNTYHYFDLNEGLIPTPFGFINDTAVDGFRYEEGSVLLPPHGDYMLVYRINSGSLAFFRVDLNTREETLAFRLGMPEPDNSGGFFSGRISFALTDDSQNAVLFAEGIDLSKACTTTDDCSDLGAESFCLFARNRSGGVSESGLCTQRKQRLFRFQLPPSDDLNQTCEEDTDCNTNHQCKWDSTSLFETIPTKICTPRSLIIGPSKFENDPCPTLGEWDSTQIAPKLEINNEGELLLLSQNDCNNLNIRQDSILAISATTLDPATWRLVEGKYPHNYGKEHCFDNAENDWVFADCTIKIHDFFIGPNGSGLAIIGSAPGGSFDAEELWLFNSKNEKYPATLDPNYKVKSLSLLSTPQN